MSYVHKGYKWDQNDIVINNIFALQVALNIIRNDEDLEPQKCGRMLNRKDWTKWKKAM